MRVEELALDFVKRNHSEGIERMSSIGGRKLVVRQAKNDAVEREAAFDLAHRDDVSSGRAVAPEQRFVDLAPRREKLEELWFSKAETTIGVRVQPLFDFGWRKCTRHSDGRLTDLS